MDAYALPAAALFCKSGLNSTLSSAVGLVPGDGVGAMKSVLKSLVVLCTIHCSG